MGDNSVIFNAEGFIFEMSTVYSSFASIQEGMHAVRKFSKVIYRLWRSIHKVGNMLYGMCVHTEHTDGFISSVWSLSLLDSSHS